VKRKFAGKIAPLLGRLAVRLARYSHAADSAHEIAVTTAIAGWPPGTADALIGHGATPTATARAFADALRAERLQ
jgi:hypothetical protein